MSVTRIIAIAAASIILTAALSTQVFAKATNSYQAEPDESQLVEHGHYANKSGQTVHSPAHVKNGRAPVGASAQCRDGSYSFSKNHRGTCSRHGGVAEWLQ
ncbi:MAG: DUF3761 domain-containing protein [Collimonas sp.]|uniref:DUF3761 domain-containing protein n=1 Tax=Collimonas sp. TaxID=1963772 RepID=UPI0032631BC4